MCITHKLTARITLRLALAVFLTFSTSLGCQKTQSSEGGAEQLATPQEKAQRWKELYEAWEDPDPIPDFELMDHEGQKFSLAAHDARYVLMGFVFTRCQVPEACPLTMKKLKEVQQLWKKEKGAGGAKGRDLQIFGVTLDPEFDTPDILKKYLLHHGGDPRSWSMVTGPEELVATALPSLFNVMALPDGKGSINHSVKVALLEPGLHFLKEWRDNKFEAGDVVKIIREHAP